MKRNVIPFSLQMFQLGDRVQLASFNGSTTAVEEVDHEENYWQLIGATGTIIQHPDESELTASFSNEKRYCVQFDKNPAILGLHCHNKVVSSLWILASDLSKLN